MSQGAAKERLRPFKPQRFGRYTLLRPLSTGGMGEIFLARLEGAQGFEKLCVIKKILPHLAQDKDFVDRFVDEARILVKLSHGNIAQVLDMGLHEGAPYIALEFIDGKDLRRVVARAQERALQLPLSFILYVTTRLLDALAYAHRKRGDDGKDLNLVHRDVSPQNILISYEGEVKVIDFGLAKSALSSNRTHPSIVLGKFLYMSPEQARHQKVDRRSDLYAVGLCLYELVAGKGPFDGVPPADLMAVVANPNVKVLNAVEPLCPPSLSDAVMKALSADPAHRFQTAEEFRGKLLSILLEIDPSAGPETASRFMTEAFSQEYQTERKLLAELNEQARSLKSVPVVDEPERAQTREVETGPAMTLDEVPQARVTAPEMKTAPLPPVEPAPAGALSFQPTRKAPPPAEKKSAPEQPGAVPSVVVANDAKLTEEVASVVVGDDLSDTAENRSRTVPETKTRATPPSQKTDPNRKARSTGAKPAPKSSAPALQKVPEKKKGLAAEDGKKTQQTTPVFDDTPAPPVGGTVKATPFASPAVTADSTPAPAAEPHPKKKGSVVVWVTLPLLAILAVGSYIAWDVYTEKLRSQQLANDPNAPQAINVDVAQPPTGPEKTREVKLTPDPPPLPEPEADDLTGVQKDVKKQAPKVVKADTKELTLRKLEALLGQVAEPGPLKMQMHLLRSDSGKLGDAEFTARAASLKTAINAKLEQQAP